MSEYGIPFTRRILEHWIETQSQEGLVDALSSIVTALDAVTKEVYQLKEEMMKKDV